MCLITRRKCRAILEYLILPLLVYFSSHESNYVHTIIFKISETRIMIYTIKDLGQVHNAFPT